MKDFCVVGLNHKTAPVELRERCAVADLPAALRELNGLADEAAVVSTCNRFEIYAYGLRDPVEAHRWIAARARCDEDEIRRHAYTRDGRNACKHLFFVAASLDSLVVGETQIRAQVRDAYRVAAETETIGPMLHALFQSALRVSKEVAERTGVGRGNVSVAGAAADLAERVFGKLDGAKVLVIGAGETAELVLTHLHGRGVKNVRIANRSLDRAATLAAQFDAEAGGLERLRDWLPDADVVVAAASGDDHHLIDAAVARDALRQRRGRPVVALDIAMPRAIDPAADELDNWYRYDMAALEAVTQDALRHRRQEFLQCCTLIDAATLRLAEATRSRRAGTVISELETRYRAIADEELAKLERRLPEAEREKVRRSVHRIVRKLLHMPVRALRSGDPAESEAIRKAFVREDDA